MPTRPNPAHPWPRTFAGTHRAVDLDGDVVEAPTAGELIARVRRRNQLIRAAWDMIDLSRQLPVLL